MPEIVWLLVVGVAGFWLLGFQVVVILSPPLRLAQSGVRGAGGVPMRDLLILSELVSERIPGCVRQTTRRGAEDTVAI